MRKSEPAERVTRRVRAHRKRQREILKNQDDNAYIRGLRDHFKAHGLSHNEWAIASDVYHSIEVLNVRLPFEKFVEGVVGIEGEMPIKSIETSVLAVFGGEKILLMRPAKIPIPRRSK
jgi:hypothetical protein